MERKDYKEMQPQSVAPAPGPVDVSTVFTGTGLSAITVGGAYNLNDVNTYTIIIDHVAELAEFADTFKWKKNGGAFTENVLITGTAQALTDSVTITFPNLIGHVLSDQWVITQAPRARFYMDDANWMSLVLKDGTVVTPAKASDLKATRTGTVAVTGLEATKAIVFATAMPSANYKVVFERGAGTATTLFPSAKTTAGFTMNISPVGLTETVGYIAIQD